MTNARSLARRILDWSRTEIRLVVLLLITAAALLGFAELVDEVLEGGTDAFDRSILLALRSTTDLSDPIGPRWLELAVRDITSLGGTTVLSLITIAAIGYLVADRKGHTALLLFGAVAGGVTLSYGMKLFVERPRPDVVSHLVEVQTLSFPSGHAMQSAVTFLTLGAILARAQARQRMKLYVMSMAAGLTLLIGISRIFLGVHWPTDVLAGWALGSAWAIACWIIAERLQARRTVEPAE